MRLKVLKDRLIRFLAVAAFLIMIFSAFTAFSLRNTEKTIEHTGVYTQRQVNSAMNHVARHFSVKYLDCKLLQLYTDEKGVSSENRLVILADYYVGNNINLHPSHQCNELYTRWEFEVKNICGLWFVTNQGYC